MIGGKQKGRRAAGVLALVTLGSLLFAGRASAQEELVSNGGFEDELQGWMWEQWAGKPLPGAAEKTDKAEGTASFRFGLSGGEGGRWLAKEIPIRQPGRDHTLTFQLKLDNVPEGDARVRVAIPQQGFLKGGDLVRVGGTQGWKAYQFPISAADLHGAAKVTVFFYHDQVGSGRIGIDGLSLKAGTGSPGAANIALTGDTARPDLSTFAYGQPVELFFDIAGLTTGDAAGLTLDLDIVDEQGRKIDSRKLPAKADTNGKCRIRVTAPNRRLGFYRVRARLSNGVELQALGSRPAGFLTYCIVPDPAKRIDYGEEGSLFAMQGAPGEGDACSLIGARWVLDDSLFWRRTEPDSAGQFGASQIQAYATGHKPGSDIYRVHTLPTLFVAPTWAVVPETLAYQTGKLTPEGEKAWAEYCKTAARAYIAKNPGRKKRIYQITWEPIRPWGFKGSDADLIRIYEIAHKALHEADPNAVVAGPCRGIWNNGDPQDTIRLLKSGLGKYLDAYSAHPYYSITPEKDGMVQAIRTMKETLRATAGKSLPLYGSEQGWSTDEDISKEVLQAQVLLRQNLITLGEGFRFNFAFYFYDYRLSGQKGYGYYYNLDPSIPFGTKKVSPKPIAPAYAAQSMLLDGSRSAGAIEWLGENLWGYAFERRDGVTLALWNYGSKARAVSLPTGVPRVRVFDWMGNERVVDTRAGTVTLTLGPEPVYVRGVSPRLWGASAANLLRVDASRLKAYPQGRVSLTGRALLPAAKPFRGSLQLEVDSAGALKPVTRPLALGGSKPSPFRFDLNVPAGLRPGTYPGRLRLRNAAGETLTATAVALEVAPPLSVRIEPAVAPGGKPGVAVTLTNDQKQAVEGQLDFRLKEVLPEALRSDLPMIDLVTDAAKTKEVPGSVQQAAFKVPAGGSQRLVLPLPGATLLPAQRYQALATVTAKNGSRFAQTAPVNFLTASHLPQPVKIDGELGEWASLPGVVLSGPQNIVRSPQLCPSGFAAKLWYAWDEQALYLAAEVKDDAFVQSHTGTDTWRGDCLQLAFDLDPKTPGGADAGERRTSEITVALTPNGAEAYRGLAYSPERLPLGPLVAPQIQVAIRRDGAEKLRYEMAIPWTSLGVAAGQAVKPGVRIGVAATVNEVRDAAQGDPSALGIFGGITPDKDPDKLGTLLLGAGR